MSKRRSTAFGDLLYRFTTGRRLTKRERARLRSGLKRGHGLFTGKPLSKALKARDARIFGWNKKFCSKNPLLQVVLPNRGKRKRNPFDVWAKRGWEMYNLHGAPFKTRKVARSKARSVTQIHGYPTRIRQVPRDVPAWDPRRSKGWSALQGNPLVKGRKRGVRGEQDITVGGFVSKAVASTYPGFARALELHRKFHGREPVHFTRVRLEDGQPHVTRKAVVMIGEAPAIEYRTWRHADSKKSYTRDGRRITWRHKMGEDGGKPAYYVHDPLSGVTSLLGGTYRIAGRPAFYHN